MENTVFICSGHHNIFDGWLVAASSAEEAAEIAANYWWGDDVAEEGRGQFIDVCVIPADYVPLDLGPAPRRIRSIPYETVENFDLDEDDREAMEEAWESYSVPVHAPEPECVPVRDSDDEHEHEHDWVTPVEVVGGCAQDPGVWSEGSRTIYRDVCSRCGMYRLSESEFDKPWLITEYLPADERSLRWISNGAYY